MVITSPLHWRTQNSGAEQRGRINSLDLLAILEKYLEIKLLEGKKVAGGLSLYSSAGPLVKLFPGLSSHCDFFLHEALS